MIGRIAGKLVYSQPPHLMIDCNGVSYEIEAPLSVFFDLPGAGKPVVLFTHLVVRDDAHLLFGFSSVSQRAMFRELIKVSGVGAKVAIAILSGLSAEEFTQRIVENDVAALTRLPGIGKKIAERLIVEMKDRVQKLDLGAPAKSGVGKSGAAPSGSSVHSQAVAALESLGFKNTEAQRMVKGVEGGTVEEVIRKALKAVTA